MKLKKITKIQIIGCIIGLSLLLYPTISNYWNSKHATQAINNYLDSIIDLTDEDYQKYLDDANKYNKDLLDRDNYYTLPANLEKRYDKLLNINNDGIMGYIDIEKIGVSLPIYHGTTNDVLQRAIGHLDWSSLPVGGISTHGVVSGHRGLPNMKLFTDLDDLVIGDIFSINVLKDTIFYEIDSIKIVDPDNVEDLIIEKDKDYFTLVTCTPYGINTHRLLVRGHRINKDSKVRIVSEAVIVDPIIVAIIIAIPFLIVLVLIVVFKKPKQKPNIRRKK